MGIESMLKKFEIDFLILDFLNQKKAPISTAYKKLDASCPIETFYARMYSLLVEGYIREVEFLVPMKKNGKQIKRKRSVYSITEDGMAYYKILKTHYNDFSD